MSDRFEHHARTVTLLTFVSRITGLARDASLSRVFGAGMLMDAFFFAFMIPNLFRRLFGEGALAAAFLPVYASLERDDPKQARQLATLTVSWLMTILGCVTLVGELILYLISVSASHDNLAVWLMMVMLPYMPMVCLVAVLGAMLQVHGRFGPTAAAPIVLNLCIIATAIGVPYALDVSGERMRMAHVGVVAASVVLAGVLQVLWSMWALRREKWWVKDSAAARPALRRVLAQAGPMIVGLGVLQLNTFFDGLIASYPTTVGPTIFGIDYPLAEGAMAAVSFAQRLYQFPLGVFGIAVATAIFPLLARQANDDEAFGDTVRRGLRLVVFIGLPASAGLILVREPLAGAILQGGAFGADDTRHVGFVLLGYAPAIWAYSMVHVLTRAFYAKSDARTPVRIAVGVVALNLTLNLTLIWTPLKESGLAWSTAICSVVQVTLLLAALRRRTGFRVGREVVQGWTRSLVVTTVMSLLVLVVLIALPPAAEWWRAVVVLGASVLMGVVTVIAAAGVLRMPELWWALGRRV